VDFIFTMRRLSRLGASYTAGLKYTRWNLWRRFFRSRALCIRLSSELPTERNYWGIKNSIEDYLMLTYKKYLQMGKNLLRDVMILMKNWVKPSDDVGLANKTWNMCSGARFLCKLSNIIFKLTDRLPFLYLRTRLEKIEKPAVWCSNSLPIYNNFCYFLYTLVSAGI
jgi:hypothetical protein